MSHHTDLTVMSLELHCVTRQKLTPDPEFDSIGAFFFVVTNDVSEENPTGREKKIEGFNRSQSYL